MKTRFLLVFLLSFKCIYGTSVKDIQELRDSGFNEDEILELIDDKNEFGAKEFIELKKNDFSKEFIIGVREKLVELQKQNQKQIVQMIQPIPNQEKILEEGIIDKVRKWNATVRKVDAVVERALKISPQYELYMSPDSVQRETTEKESKFGDIVTEAKSLAAELPIFDLDVFPKDQYDAKILSSIVDDIETSFGHNLSYRDLSWTYNFIIRDQREGEEHRKTASKFWWKAQDSKRLIAELIINESEAISFIPKNGSYEEVKRGITYQGTWKNSKNEGKRLGFYQSGEKEGIDNWVDGVKEGQEIRWHANGKKKYEATWNNTGTKTGEEQSWYESGQLKQKTNWDSSGQKNGEESEFYRNGDPQTLSLWNNGSLEELKKFNESKDLIVHKVFEDELPVSIRQKVDGKERYQSFSLNNDMTASLSLFDEAGHMQTKTFFLTEDKSISDIAKSSHFLLKSKSKTFYLLLDGEYVFKNEGISYEGKFEKGIPVGLHKFSDNNNSEYQIQFSIESNSGGLLGELNGTIDGNAYEGSINFSHVFSNGWRHPNKNRPTFNGKVYVEGSSQILCFENNVMLKFMIGDKHHTSKNVTLLPFKKFCVEDFYENGNPKAKIIFWNGVLNGVCELLRSDGTKMIEANYKNGTRNGTTRIYHSNGKISCEIKYEDGIIGKKISAFYEDGQSYNPKSGFLSTKYSLKYSKDSIWRVGAFSKGFPSNKQSELNRLGQEIQSFEFPKDKTGIANINDALEWNSTNNYGIFEMRFDPENKNYPSFKDYDQFAVKDFHFLISYRQEFSNLNSIFDNMNFLKSIKSKLDFLELDIEFVDSLAKEKLVVRH